MSGNLFYGLEINHESTRNEVLRTVDDLRSVVPRATWTSPDKLHLTLLFLGAVPETFAYNTLERACRGLSPFHITFNGTGYFVNNKGPRVLYATVAEGKHHLVKLNQALGGKGTYNPHLTLGKLEQSGDFAPAFSGMAKRLKDHDFGSVRVSSIKLYRTVGGGRPYQVVAEHGLSA
jgi:2'-5' RNA ligase